MAKYDLTGSLEAEFSFAIGDKEFKFKKPTVREMRAIGKKFAVIEKETDLDKQTALSEEAMDELYKFIEPVNHGEKLKELMEDQPVGVQSAFNEMVKKELGATT